MTKIPKVCICIPCYNAEKYVGETIQSILDQTYHNFILHIVDNNSSDETLKIMKRFRDKRIIIHKNNHNIGMFQNMNKCLFFSISPYIKIVCADDLIEKTQIEEQVKILDKYSNVALVYNASNIINEVGKIIFRRRFLRKDRRINGGVLINKILKTGRNPVGEPTGIMFRRNIVERYNLKFSDSFQYISDLDMWIEILKHGNGYYIDKILSSFRFHNSSGTVNVFKKAIKEHFKLTAKYSEEFNLSLFDHMLIYYKLIFYMLLKRILLKIAT